MSFAAIQRLLALTAALVAAVAWLIAGHQAAEAGHTTGESHCLSSPPNCVFQYSADGQNLVAIQRSFSIRNWRGAASHWDNSYEKALDTAEFNWAKAVGPQVPSEPIYVLPDPRGIPLGPDNRYSNCPDDGDPLPGACFLVGAYVCRRDEAWVRYCQEERVNTVEAETYIWDDFFDEWPEPKASIMAHEFGHVLGLWHHDSSSCLMQLGTTLTAPQACDLGFADPIFSSPPVAPCDSVPDDYGIRCIYRWWREQAPLLDCYDLDRSGSVDLANDILGTILAYQTSAGEPDYHPEADNNRDGYVDLPNDILGVLFQYQDVCGPPDHYPYS